MNKDTKINPNETCETIKLGIDAHAKWYFVARQIDGVTPKPVQKMTFSGLLRFVGKQKGLCRNPSAGDSLVPRLQQIAYRRGCRVIGVFIHPAQKNIRHLGLHRLEDDLLYSGELVIVR